ncbi:unnamed protein product [Choristocarpus tenellus]
MIPARSGRQLQRYDGSTRLVAGCLPVLPDGKVVLVCNKRRDGWILPKGGWESDETAEQAAAREAYEEAGVRGAVGRSLGSHHILSSAGNSSRLEAFVLHVSEVLDVWPESGRRRKMVRNLEEDT